MRPPSEGAGREDERADGLEDNEGAGGEDEGAAGAVHAGQAEREDEEAREDVVDEIVADDRTEANEHEQYVDARNEDPSMKVRKYLRTVCTLEDTNRPEEIYFHI